MVTNGKHDPWPEDEVTLVERDFLRAPTADERAAMFGAFKFEAAPTKGDPEGIRILGDWATKCVVPIKVSQLKRLRGDNPIWVHKLIVGQVLDVFDAWEAAGVVGDVLTFDGAFNPRYKRGRAGQPAPASLSSHSWGTAIDLNAAWNPQGKAPAPLHAKGTTLRLVSIAQRHGFAWGGAFAAPRTDAMHFEAAKIM